MDCPHCGKKMAEARRGHQGAKSKSGAYYRKQKKLMRERWLNGAEPVAYVEPLPPFVPEIDISHRAIILAKELAAKKLKGFDEDVKAVQAKKRHRGRMTRKEELMRLGENRGWDVE